jgi:hypothetical protein
MGAVSNVGVYVGSRSDPFGGVGVEDAGSSVTRKDDSVGVGERLGRMEAGEGSVRSGSGLNENGVGVCATPQIGGDETQAVNPSEVIKRSMMARFTGYIRSKLYPH